MFSLNMFLFMLAVTLLTVTVESSSSSSSSGGRNYNYDLSGPDLTRLYNSPVYLAEKMKTRLGSSSFVAGPISHSGVRVTLADGKQWLIHKGGGFGISSDTVVVDARHMGPDWKPVSRFQLFAPASKNFHGTKTVSDFVRAGGSEYSWWADNCHIGSNRMMNQ